MMFWSSLFVVTILSSCQAAIQEDEVKKLPGLAAQPKFKHYSGYLNATGSKRLHYWFVEAQSSPQSAPVVLWLNGGPGCSSMDGMLTEHGPFRVDNTGKTITMNPYSWNLIANMLYIEAPAGVGYSYSTDKNYTTTDDQVSLDNYYALKYFFMRYPEFQQNEFFITGESYGGIYVPTLASRVVENNHFNFKGFAVGNGMSDYKMAGESLIYFGYMHGLWGKSLWQKLVSSCCNNGNTSDCNFGNPVKTSCIKAVQEASMKIGSLNVYNMYAECYGGPSVAKNNRTLFQSTDIMMESVPSFRTRGKELHSMAKVKKVAVSPPCIDTRGITAYMNNPDVKTALHIPSDLPEWEICSGVVGASYIRQYDTMMKQYEKVLSTGKQRILVYNGDIDMACNFLMDEWFTDALGQKVIEESRAWMYTAKDGSQQIGGFAKHFDNLVYTTVRGAGHMVPTDRPIPALTMFKAFIKGHKL